MNILIITYNWPPRNAIGTHRPYSWAKYWSKAGVNVTVLTATKCFFDSPLDLQLPIIEKVKVIEVPYCNEAYLTKNLLQTGKITNFLRVIKSAKNFLLKNMGLKFDVRAKWARVAQDIACNLASDADVVVSTFGPAASHSLAAKIKQGNSKIIWVADYRDLWSCSHLIESPFWVKNKMRKEEIKTVGKYADKITTVSDGLAFDLTNFLNKNVDVILNGFDISESQLKENLYRGDLPRKEGKISIVYTGMIYPGRRDPTPILKAINNLIQCDDVFKDKFEVVFYGASSESIDSIIHKNKAGKYVRCVGHVNRDEALKAQKNADYVMLLESGKSDAKGVLTGKVFEYIASGTPIISLGSKHDSSIGRLLNETGCGMCYEDDVEAIKNMLKNKVVGTAPDWYTPNFTEIIKYSREAQAEIMLHKIIQMQ